MERLAKYDAELKELMESDKFLDLILEEIKKKVEGETDTCKAIFLHLMCAWVKNTSSLPHIFVNSESSSGKSYICKQIINIFPDENYEYRTKITPEAFTYWHNSKYEESWTWDGKMCYLEDVRDDIINSSTFKVMASEGSKATVVIKHRAVDIEIKGNPVIMITAASTMPNTEIINRFSIINLDETPEQTKRIKRKQLKDAIAGNSENYNPIFKDALRELLRVEVRLPTEIINVGEYFPDDVLRVRRDFPRFLDIMKASAALFQKQRDMDLVSKIVYANELDYETARSVMEKLDTSGGVFGLTYRLKRCYKSCVEFSEKGVDSFSAKEMFQFNPIVTEKSWKNILDRLAREGILKVDMQERHWTNKPVTVFLLKDKIKLKLPPYKQLINETKVANEVKNSVVRKEDREENETTEANEVMEVNEN